MTNYRFWPAFLKYAGILFALLSVLFIIIVILFSYKLNQEINETAKRQTLSVQTTLAQHQNVNPTHDYFVVKHGKIIEASTPFSTRELETRFLQNSTSTPYIIVAGNLGASITYGN